MKIITASEMKQLEAEAEKIGITPPILMENAGLEVAGETRRMLGCLSGKKILVLIGPGNNGGDGEVAARHLCGWGAEVTLCLCSARPDGDTNLRLAEEQGASRLEIIDDVSMTRLEHCLSSADAVIDAVFGTGQSRAIEGIFQKVLCKLSEAKNARPSLKIISVDLPSGLNADNGAADPSTPFVDLTVTLGLPKRGLYAPSGAERAGEVVVAAIGIPPQCENGLKTILMTRDRMRGLLPQRSPYAHKGTFGRLLVAAGSINYTGAAYLACSAAVRVGAGLVTLAIPKTLQPMVAAGLSEATYLPLAEASSGTVFPEAYRTFLAAEPDYDVVLIGCGLGQKQQTREFALKTIFRLEDTYKLVMDADALNYLAEVKGWWNRIPFNAVMTPHPGEMARLCGVSAVEVQANRFELAQEKAAEWNKTIVLKGANTIIASPDGRMMVNPFASAGMATAGTGDVLAGAIAGLLAQSTNLFEGACLGVYLHSLAGEAVGRRLGDAGIIASDLLPELPLAIKELKEKP